MRIGPRWRVSRFAQPKDSAGWNPIISTRAFECVRVSIKSDELKFRRLFLLADSWKLPWQDTNSETFCDSPVTQATFCPAKFNLPSNWSANFFYDCRATSTGMYSIDTKNYLNVQS